MPEISTVAWAALGLLLFLGVFDLWVGVANDAVNFINSAVGARAARRTVIFGITSVALVIGCLFADGMMEVARKGIFHPSFFLTSGGRLDLNLLLTVYVGVMIADVILLDAYNTYGLPTSTTVSIVSDLVGAALAVGVWTLGPMRALEIINQGQVVEIYSGIGLSVLVAFVCGYALMFAARLLFTFRPESGFARWGWLFTGLAGTALFYFVVIVGGKHASFMTKELKATIDSTLPWILGSSFAVCALLGFVFRHRYAAVQKGLILVGTAGLAIAFAGNDLVNFIGPTVAAFQAAFQPAIFEDVARSAQKVSTPTLALILAGGVMILTLWTSRKARTVTDTEVRLGHQGAEEEELFRPNPFARFLVDACGAVARFVLLFVPSFVRRWAAPRLDPANMPQGHHGNFDLMRGTVNLIVAGVLISIGTSFKLPLSTTFVTFMVAMGTSLADGAWDAKVAPARVAGVLTVVGGWAVTAVLAVIGAFGTTSVLYWLGLGPGMVVLALLFGVVTWQLSQVHTRRNHGKRTTVDRMDERNTGDSSGSFPAATASMGIHG